MKMKRFVALLFACCLSLSLATTSFAIEKVPLIPEDQITRASTVPTTHKNLGAGRMWGNWLIWPQQRLPSLGIILLPVRVKLTWNLTWRDPELRHQLPGF